MARIFRIPANSRAYLFAIVDEAAGKFDVKKLANGFRASNSLTNAFKIPASTEAYLMAVRDETGDVFDVVDLVYNYHNSNFPKPWAYWKMEEESGWRYDATGNGHTLKEVWDEIDSSLSTGFSCYPGAGTMTPDGYRIRIYEVNTGPPYTTFKEWEETAEEADYWRELSESEVAVFNDGQHTYIYGDIVGIEDGNDARLIGPFNSFSLGPYADGQVHSISPYTAAPHVKTKELIGISVHYALGDPADTYPRLMVQPIIETIDSYDYSAYLSRVTGKVNYGLGMDDADDTGVWLNCETWPELNNEAPFTLAVWVKVADSYAGFNLYVGDMTLYFGGQYVYGCGWGSAYVDSPDLVSVDDWHLLVVTFDGTTMKLYIDNEMVSESEGTTECDPEDNTTSMWCWDGACEVEEGAIWQEALTAEQVAYLWNSGSGRSLY